MKIRTAALTGILTVALTLVSSSVMTDTTRKAPLPLSKVASFTSTDGLTHVEKNVRRAAVKVRRGGGHGSGSYVMLGGFHVIITAQHVADGVIGSTYTIAPPTGKSVSGRLVWSNEVDDIAVILVPEIESRRPMHFDPLDEPAQVGTVVTYSGHPSHFSLLSFRGMIAGQEKLRKGKSLVLHSYGWFGCSGSVVYDLEGQMVGVLWGVSVAGRSYGARIQEDLTFLTPAHKIKEKAVVKAICGATPSPQRCR